MFLSKNSKSVFHAPVFPVPPVLKGRIQKLTAFCHSELVDKCAYSGKIHWQQLNDWYEDQLLL